MSSTNNQNSKTSLSAGRFLFLYPFFFTLLLKLIQIYSIFDVKAVENFRIHLQADSRIAHDILIEPKLMNKWMGGGLPSLQSNISSNFVDESGIRRFIIGYNWFRGLESQDLVKEGVPQGNGVLPVSYSYVVTKLGDESKVIGRGVRETLKEYKVRLYATGPYFDLDYRFTLTPYHSESLTIMTVEVTTGSSHIFWKILLTFGSYFQRDFMNKCFTELALEINSQYKKKLKVIQDFGLDEEQPAENESENQNEELPESGVPEETSRRKGKKSVKSMAEEIEENMKLYDS